MQFYHTKIRILSKTSKFSIAFSHLFSPMATFLRYNFV